MDICSRIAAECERQNRSVFSVMTKAKLGSSIFYKWQNGKSKPRAKTVMAIAKTLGVKPEDLCPEMSQTFEAIAEVGGERFDENGIDSDDVVFIGITKRTLNHLRPLIELADAGFVEVPDAVSKGLRNLVGSFTKLGTLTLAPF